MRPCSDLEVKVTEIQTSLRFLVEAPINLSSISLRSRVVALTQQGDVTTPSAFQSQGAKRAISVNYKISALCIQVSLGNKLPELQIVILHCFSLQIIPN